MKLKLKFDGCFLVDSDGSSGGLLLLWDKSISMSVRSFPKGHIDVVVDDGYKK